MPVIPLYDNIIVQLAKTEEVSEGGIHIPETVHKNDQVVAYVVAIGQGKILSSGQLLPLPVLVGDGVVLDQFSGTKFSHKDEDYIAVSIDDVLAILR